MILRDPRRLLVASAALTLLLAGCGAELGDGARPSGGGDAVTTTTGPPKQLTIEDLEKIRPQAKDVPDAYRTAPGTGDDEAEDEAVEESCPDLVPYLTGDDDPATDVQVQFQAQDVRALAIKLSLAPEIADADDVQAFVAAAEACDGYGFEDDDGVEFGIAFTSAEPLDGYGDLGVRYVLTQTIEVRGQTIEREVTALRFVRNGVGISTGAISGLREPDYEPIEADIDVAEQLAKDLDATIEELTR